MMVIGGGGGGGGGGVVARWMKRLDIGKNKARF